jgi:uncharacterized membrane protein
MLKWFPFIPEWIQEALFPLNRWMHIVCTTLIVGGTLFYEFVIPKAIEDLKEESQLAVLGRVRWFFRQVVIFSALMLIISGAVALYHQYAQYSGIFRPVRGWMILHIALGLFALLIGVVAMARRRAPRSPLIWLRINFVILLIVVFVAAVSRHVRMMVRDNMERFHIQQSDAGPNNPSP